MYAPQGVQLTGTNRPRTYHNSYTICESRPRPLCASERTNTPPQLDSGCTRCFFTRVTAATAKGKRPDPFRTRKLSPPAPMVLPAKEGGRVGHRRTPTTPGRGFHHRKPLPAFMEPRAGLPPRWRADTGVFFLRRAAWPAYRYRGGFGAAGRCRPVGPVAELGR
jgi:hypothetical protein